jgi:hypothetical protein
MKRIDWKYVFRMGVSLIIASVLIGLFTESWKNLGIGLILSIALTVIGAPSKTKKEH